LIKINGASPRRRDAWQSREIAMSAAEIVVLTGVCCAFVVFAAVLAWGEGQTRNIGRDRAIKPRAAPVAAVSPLKIVATQANTPPGVSRAGMAGPTI
jgi:hypothetical protein